VASSSLAEVLRARGLRLTAQRQLVLEAVYSLGHATPDQVHAAVAQTAAGINITTVYRTLELLEELGLVTHAHLSHGAPTYHPAGEDQHVHLVCRLCGGVDEVSPRLLDGLVAALAGRRGFLVDIGHVALFGLCAACAERAGAEVSAAEAGLDGAVPDATVAGRLGLAAQPAAATPQAAAGSETTG
jgi:Fur family transcriptional regulator, ferric uptake regulator